jgi:diketogulonate reductase-like aldo/keto reductase
MLDDMVMTRREASRLIIASAGAAAFPIGTSNLRGENDSSSMLQRAIPSSGEKIPVIGLGTWQTFDVGESPTDREPLEKTLALFAKLGGRVVDSSPMYGQSEEVIGELAEKLGLKNLFLATKVWTRGKEAGLESIERSFSRLRTKRIDLLQVHNLVDLKTQLQTIRELKEKGRVRYVGVTHYESGAFGEVEQVLKSEPIDFLQINYSVGEPEAEERLLPLARDKGVAVLVNRPFGGGDLFRKVRTKPLPGWAKDISCPSWAQFFLQWIVSHPAVTCVIPATNNPDHLKDNMEAGRGALPSPEMRRRMAEYVLAL